MIDPELKLLIRELAEQPISDELTAASKDSVERSVQLLILAARRIDGIMRRQEWISSKPNRVTILRPFPRD